MLSINISELIWTIINFILLLFLLRKFLYRPICDFMDARQEKIDDKLQKEREAQEALRAEDARQEAEREAARENARVLLQQAQAEAEQESGQALLSAKASAKEAEKQTQQRLREANRQEGDRLTQAEPALAALLAGRLLEEGEET